jgi:hypothetical protein
MRCANCDAPIAGPYCASCGQETRVGLPTARAFLRDAAGRYVALDGRLWRTLVALFFRPGFLTLEYLAGRRRRYIRPARLFLVLSLLLFALLRVTAPDPYVVEVAETQSGTTRTLSQELAVDTDLLNPLEGIDSKWTAPLKARIAAFNRLTIGDKLERMSAGLFRYAPYAMVALLPVFAAMLQLAYVSGAPRHPARPRQYAAHLVFGAHSHAFLFLCAALAAALPLAPLRAALLAWSVAYLLLALKRVYGGSWPGIVLRASMLGTVYAVLIALAIVALLLAAIVL